MPELPDVAIYIESLDRHIAGARLEDVRLFNPFLLRTVDPPIAAARESTSAPVAASANASSSVWRMIFSWSSI